MLIKIERYYGDNLVTKSHMRVYMDGDVNP